MNTRGVSQLKYGIFICVLYVAFFSTRPIQAKGKFTPLQCTLTGLAEIILPGSGYAISGQYMKALGIGGLKYYLLFQASEHTKHQNYQTDVDQYYYNDTVTKQDIENFDYLDDEDKDKNFTLFAYNRSTFYGRLYLTHYGNLAFYSFWDLTTNDCDENPDWYKPFIAFSDVQTYGTSPFFWGVVIAIGFNIATDNGISSWYLGDGLKYKDVENNQYLQHYLVGVGEETFFRGSIQNSMYSFFQNYFTDFWAWHWGVVTSSIIFGLAHNGEGGSASVLQASLGGLVFGYAYQPSPNKFELSTSVVMHTLWNMSVVYTLHKNKRKVTETESTVSVSDARTNNIPLFNFAFSFR